MSQAAATKLVSKLKFNIHDRRRLRNPDGPQGRHNKIKKTVTALLKYERIELNYNRADESRGYAERLISEAIRNGDHHEPTMKLASYWIIEPQIVHKLFKVLVPRYKFHNHSYTKLWRAPSLYPSRFPHKSVLELRNNIYPPLGPNTSHHKNQIHNVLLEEARKAYIKAKEESAEEMAKEALSESSASQPEITNNLKTESIVDDNAISESVSELPNDTNLKADSKDESKVENETNSSVETDVDISKLKIEDEKENTTENDKKT